jgi:hypothetical protein
MVARRLGLRSLTAGEARAALFAAGLTLILSLLAMQKLGSKGLLVPLIAVVAVILISRPKLAVGSLLLVTVLAEGPTFGLLHFTSHVYSPLYKQLTALDFMVVVAVISVGVDLLRTGRPVRVPRPLLLPLGILALAMIAGAVTGHAAGSSLRVVLTSEDTLAYLLLIPIAVSNLELERREVMFVVQGVLVLAAVKAVLGLAEIVSGKGQAVEGTARLTYYEPAANWLISIAILTVFAALVARTKPPRWMLVSAPLLLASLILSYRRSFWVALVLALLLVLLLGTRPTGRRLLLPAALMVVVAVWLLSSVHFQAQSPIARRFSSLSPTQLQSNVEDRYRIDERANVWGEIRQHPIQGLGMNVPWEATVRPLPVEHEDGRQYVHFAALWFWLKLGILGLAAYVGMLAGSLILAFQAWRKSHEPLLRAFGLASLCAIVSLGVLDTTASFTGVDARFTVLFGAQIGLLGLVLRVRDPSRESPGVAYRGD